MSGDGDNKTSSGIRLEAKPTVIGGTKKSVAPICPTVIQGRPVPERPVDQQSGKVCESKPTVIVGGKANEKPKAHQVDIQPVSKATVIKPPPPKPPIALEKPSAIAGVARKGVEVTREALLSCFPGTDEAVVEKSIKLLRQTVVEIITESQGLQWGMKTQQRYGELVQESLSLSSHKSIQDSNRHLNRLLNLLQEISAEFQEKDGWFGKKKGNPWEKFQEVRPEILQLSSLLNQLLPELIRIQSSLGGIAREHSLLVIELDAEAISAKYLAEQLGTSSKHQSVVNCLMSRSLSLVQTVAQMQQGTMTRQSTIQDIEKLVSRVQDGVLVKLPAWTEQIGAYQSKSAITETDAYTCRQQLADVVAYMQ